VPRSTAWRLGFAATRFGQTGVDLFFVLSGFLITGILLDAKGSRRYFVNFYGRRTLRIFPLYYGFCFLTLAVLPPLVGSPVTGLTWLSLGTFTANFALAAGTDGGLIGHFWSLAIEEQFYLGWPFFVCYLGRSALMRVCVASLVGSAILRLIVGLQGISAFMLTPCRIDTLLVGALLALAASSPLGLIEWSRRATLLAVSALAAGLPFCLTMSGSGSALLQVIRYPIIACLYGAILVIAVTTPASSRTGRFLTFKPLALLGRYSFGMYVYHPPMIHLVHWLLGLTSFGLGIRDTVGGPELIVRVALIGAGSYALAWASWHGFERPFLSLKRFFEYEPAPASATSAVAVLYKSPLAGNDRPFPVGPTVRT
jgi:peptidoglycan/LPS O-acetylase OafA/YrhL